MPPIFVGDQSQICIFYESGTTFGTASGTAQWWGAIQSHEVDENTGVKKKEIRYVGAGTRDVATFEDEASSYEGTLSFYPQDWRFLKYALGRCADGGSPVYTHTITAADSNNSCKENGQILPTFTIEDAQRVLIGASGLNFIRTYNGGTVDSATISIAEGEPVSVEIGYRAKTVSYASGTASDITPATTPIFKWEHFVIHLPSGTALNTVKSCEISINNNLNPPYYLNGTRDIGMPIPENRDYEVKLTLNGDAAITKTIYDQYFIGGSTFNMLVVGTATPGSNIASITMSGCELKEFKTTTAPEGIAEHELTIVPKTMSAIITDTNHELYNAGSYDGTA